MAIRMVPFPPSTNISSITWDDETLDMVIDFQKGGQYVYQQVTESDAMGFGQAPSASKYLKTFIETLYIPIRTA